MKYIGYSSVFLAVFSAVFALTLATPSEVSGAACLSGILAVIGIGVLVNTEIKP